MADLPIYALTYNCARHPIDPSIFARNFFDALTPNSPPPEILTISLQEIAPIAYSFLGGSYLVPYFDRVRRAIDIAATGLGDGSGDVGGVDEDEVSEGKRGYVEVVKRNVGMTAVMVFVRRGCLGKVKWVETAGVGVGVLGMGNKGAVALRLGYAVREDEELEISLVAAHLAPMEDALERRNEDWKNICRGLVFTPFVGKAIRMVKSQARTIPDDSEDDVPLLQGDPDNSTQPSSGLFNPRSHVIIAGDLNYRTSLFKPAPTDYHSFPQPCKDKANARHYSNLLKEDQLTREKNAQRTCHGLQEAPIDFPPTYKYSDKQRAIAEKDDGLMWDWAKHRWPSWCDRILYTALPPWMKAGDLPNSIRTLRYTALPLMSTSDHRPVALSLSFPAKAIPLPGSNLPQEDVRLNPPFEIDPNWKSKRAAARRRELVTGILAFIALTWEGRIALLATIVGFFVGWWIIDGILGT